MGCTCDKDDKMEKKKDIKVSNLRTTSASLGKEQRNGKEGYMGNRSNRDATPFKHPTERNEVLTDRSQLLSLNLESNPVITRSEQKVAQTKGRGSFAPELQSTEANTLKFIRKHNRECEDSQLIERCLMNNSFMRSLDKQARSEIVKQMSLCFVPKETVIFKQGMMGSYFYILKEGSVQLLINDKPIKSLNEGDNFGELALLYGAPRSGTIIAETDCYMWVMERKNFKKIVDHITFTYQEENKSIIQLIPILSFFEPAQKSTLCSFLYKEVFEPGTHILKEGELASCIYFIREGAVDISFKGTHKRTLHKGDYFGEKSIFADSTRTINAIAKTQCMCLSLSVSSLKNLFGESYRQAMLLHFIKSAFQSSKLFRPLYSKMLDTVLPLFKLRDLTEDKLAFDKGYAPSSRVVIVITGALIKTNSNEVTANKGDVLFENELLNDSRTLIDYSIVAKQDCLLAEADSAEVIAQFDSSLKSIIEKSAVIHCIQHISMFKHFTQRKLQLLINQIHTEAYQAGSRIITQGEEGTKFFIVKLGKIDISRNGQYIRTINQNDYLGERALFFKEPRSATAIASTDVEVYYLEKDAFLSCIEENMKKHLLNRLYLQDDSIQLSDLQYVDALGSGNYGLVALVLAAKSKFRYAIKSIMKKQIESEQLLPNLELERAILLQIDHPFIVKLVKTLKDSENIFFLMEYIRGKELFDVIRDIGLLSKSQTQFYTASMMLAVEYLHERRFIYRDIKPENIIVVDDGYIKLIDFGTAKKIIGDSTSTVIGTPHYMAPEVILGEGYSFNVDYWSIAVCIYEFICGMAPFGESAGEPMEVYLAIINEQLRFPSYCKDKDFKHFISQMLSKNPLSRISTLAQIRSSIWFQSFDWEALQSLNMKPAFLPVLNKDDSRPPSMSYTDYLSKYKREWGLVKPIQLDSQSKAAFEVAYEKF